MLENHSLVYGRVKYLSPPPNMIFTTQSSDVECFTYNGETVVLETIEHVPATQAFKHCPAVPFTASNYAVGLPVKKIEEEDDTRISHLVQQQTMSAQILNILKNGVKLQAELPPPPSVTTIEVDKATRGVSVQLPFPHTVRHTFKPIGVLLLDMGEEITEMLKPAVASKSDSVFNKKYVELHKEYCGVVPAAKPSKRKQPASKAPESAVSTEKIPKIAAQKSEVVVKGKSIKRKNDADKNGVVKKPKNNHETKEVTTKPKPKPPPSEKRSVGGRNSKTKTEVQSAVEEIAKSIKQKSDLIVRNHDAKNPEENNKATAVVSKPKPTPPQKLGVAFRIPKINSQKAEVATTPPAKRKNEFENNGVVKKRDKNHVGGLLDMPSLLPDKHFEFKIPKIPSRRDVAAPAKVESVLPQNDSGKNHLVNAVSSHDDDKALEVEPEPPVIGTKKSSSSHSQEAAITETISEESLMKEADVIASETDECRLSTPVRSIQPDYDDDDEDVLNILADDDDDFLGLGGNFEIKNPTRVRKLF
ncbi:unnamed protein product [Orchesella dallaii]|uniref:Uncharacterized protein n=1 Tax=Orchesella dallaii TaxID=48710 RepID=A0ABP1QR33_9HEXA